MLPTNVIKRFWELGQVAGNCFEWEMREGRKKSLKRFYAGGIRYNPREVAWQIQQGEPLPENSKVTCKCGNILCVLPAHMQIIKKVTSPDINREPKPKQGFWDFVDRKGSCWIWRGRKSEKGYGVFGDNKKAHRVAYELVKGAIPEGMFVCHHCDNPPCVNPDHLFLSDAQGNMNDMWEKGRGYTKLTDAQVREIRQKYVESRIGQRKLAEEYGVTQPQIGYIVRGEQRRKAGGPIQKRGNGFKRSTLITDQQAKEIRKRFQQGESTKVLSKEFGISHSYASTIAHGKQRTKRQGNTA